MEEDILYLDRYWRRLMLRYIEKTTSWNSNRWNSRILGSMQILEFVSLNNGAYGLWVFDSMMAYEEGRDQL